MEIDREKAIELDYDGIVYYFCSEACRDKFEENPQLYLEKKPVEE